MNNLSTWENSPIFVALGTILEQIMSYDSLFAQWVTDAFILKELHGYTHYQVGLSAADITRIS